MARTIISEQGGALWESVVELEIRCIVLPLVETYTQWCDEYGPQ